MVMHAPQSLLPPPSHGFPTPATREPGPAERSPATSALPFAISHFISFHAKSSQFKFR